MDSSDRKADTDALRCFDHYNCGDDYGGSTSLTISWNDEYGTVAIHHASGAPKGSELEKKLIAAMGINHMSTIAVFSPQLARTLAAELTQAADLAEGKPPTAESIQATQGEAT